MLPTNRAVTSYTSPSRIASDATVETTSPVGRVRGSATPVRDAWCPTTWDDSRAPRHQFHTASQCRTRVDSAVTTASPSRTRHHVTRPRVLPPSMPASTARPIAHGTSAWATIQTVPMTMPSATVPHIRRPSQPM